MISISNISKSFTSDGNSNQILKDINLEIRKGEFFVLVGPSGSGKTTLLRMISGLETPDEGRLAVNDRVVFDSAKRINEPPQTRKIGMVFQSYAIWPHMTVIENVSLPLMKGHLKYSKQLAHEKAMEALKRVQMENYANRPAPLLSGGQQQRVALARGLAVSSGILLMDEPLSNLDARLREEVRNELKSLVAELGLTVVYVTHDQIEAMSLADRLAVMHQGRIQQLGSPVELYQHPNTTTVANFLGHMNWIEGHWKSEQQVETSIGVFQTKQAMVTPSAGDPVIIGFRPENVQPNTRQAAVNVFPGKILHKQFQGARTVYEFESGSNKIVSEIESHHHVTDTAEFFVEPEQILVLARDGQELPGGSENSLVKAILAEV